MSFNSEIGHKIQTAREEMGISQEQLARALDCSQAALSNYERGKRRLYLSQLEILSEILEKPLDYFVETSINTPPSLTSKRNEQVLALINNIYQLNDNQIESVHEFVRFLRWKKNKED